MTHMPPPAGYAPELWSRGLYVASRASVPKRGAMWRRLRAQGWPIISSWIDEDGEGETSDFEDLWMRVEREIGAAAGLVLYAEPEDFPLKGALIEAGMAIGMGRPVYLVAPGVFLDSRSRRPIGSWLNHPLVGMCATVEEAFLRATCPTLDKPDLAAAIERAERAYHDPTFPERPCDNPECQRPYTGPAIFCSLACALAEVE